MSLGRDTENASDVGFARTNYQIENVIQAKQYTAAKYNATVSFLSLPQSP
jgi:hypothetical protein